MENDLADYLKYAIVSPVWSGRLINESEESIDTLMIIRKGLFERRTPGLLAFRNRVSPHIGPMANDDRIEVLQTRFLLKRVPLSISLYPYQSTVGPKLALNLNETKLVFKRFQMENAAIF